VNRLTLSAPYGSVPGTPPSLAFLILSIFFTLFSSAQFHSMSNPSLPPQICLFTVPPTCSTRNLSLVLDSSLSHFT
jgi:hypothetical protein